MGLFQKIKQSAPLPFPPIKGGVSVSGIVYSDTTLLGGGGGGGGSFIIPFWSRQNVTKALIL